MDNQTAGLDLDRLEALARAVAEYSDTIGIEEWHTVDGELNLLMPRPDVELISACSPVAVLQLIDLARRAEPSVAAVDEQTLLRAIGNAFDPESSHTITESQAQARAVGAARAALASPAVSQMDGATVEPVGEIVAGDAAHGWHMKALKPWDEIGEGTLLYAGLPPTAATTASASSELIAAADRHAEAYHDDDRDGIKTDVINAFYAGSEWRKLRAQAPSREAAPEDVIAIAARIFDFKLHKQSEETKAKYLQFAAALARAPLPDKVGPNPSLAILHDDVWYVPYVAPAQAGDTRDAARLDWLNQNFFSDQKDEWDERLAPDSIKWKFFGPMSVQGDIRRVIDAAIASSAAQEAK